METFPVGGLAVLVRCTVPGPVGHLRRKGGRGQDLRPLARQTTSNYVAAQCPNIAFLEGGAMIAIFSAPPMALPDWVLPAFIGPVVGVFVLLVLLITYLAFRHRKRMSGHGPT